jgi:hypothetical protein
LWLPVALRLNPSKYTTRQAGISKNPSSYGTSIKTAARGANRAHHVRPYMNTPFGANPARGNVKDRKERAGAYGGEAWSSTPEAQFSWSPILQCRIDPRSIIKPPASQTPALPEPGFPRAKSAKATLSRGLLHFASSLRALRLGEIPTDYGQERDCPQDQGASHVDHRRSSIPPNSRHQDQRLPSGACAKKLSQNAECHCEERSDAAI